MSEIIALMLRTAERLSIVWFSGIHVYLHQELQQTAPRDNTYSLASVYAALESSPEI